MTEAGREILKQAMQLSTDDRLLIAQELWNSVDPVEAARFSVDDEFMEELRRRDEEMDAGMCITEEEMMAHLRNNRAQNREGK